MKERSTVLVVDGGGRGAALVDKYAQSKHVEKIIAIPGNDLMRINTDKPVQIFPKLKTTSVPEILEICKREKVDLVDVAQDNAVEAGLVDALAERGIMAVGPIREACQIEWDKAWARKFGEKYGLPQPFFQIFSREQDAVDFLKNQPDQPWFVKASGLAEGKGALPAKNNEEALKRVLEMKNLKNDAGRVFIIEKWLKEEDELAEEFSTFIISDGKHYQIVGSAQDHKRVNNFDEGENTGGIGCSTPPLILTPELMKDIQENILDKTIAGLSAERRPYKGVLYLGGMVIKEKGKLKPYVIEFNARWGDPEAQVILPGLKNDLFEVGVAIAQGDINKLQIKTDGKARIVVAGVSKGYPGDYSGVKGKRIYGLEEARKIDGVKLYGAAVRRAEGKDYADGGRLFYFAGSRGQVYQAMSLVFVEDNNLHYRTDIGWRDRQRFYQGKYDYSRS